MSSLHIKYRPTDFDSFHGNESTVAALQKVLEREEPPHAILLTGNSGCGKTTLARIIASELGALDMERDVDKNPNYREYNTADFRGIDSVRTMRASLGLKGLNGGRRVFLLDEVHQLTGDAQEAMLKMMEDSPPHVFFIFATTNPEKLKDTFKRRCTAFEVHPLDDDEIISLCRRVCKREKKKVADAIFELVVKQSAGSPGRALAYLDSVIDVDEDEAANILDRAQEVDSHVKELCTTLLNKKKHKWADVAKILKGLGKEDPERVRRAVLGYMDAVMLSNGSPTAFIVMSCFREPFFNTGRPGLTMACGDVFFGE